MFVFSLSWVFGSGDQAMGGECKNPSWEKILSCLEEVGRGKGSVTLDVREGENSNFQSLQVLADEGNYVVTIGEDDGFDYLVRSYKNTELKNLKFDILGDMYDGILVCVDFGAVVNIFRCFYESGNVSKDLLD